MSTKDDQDDLACECEVTLQFFTIREILFAVLDKAKINALYQVEKTTVNRQNKLTTHLKQQKKFLSFVSSQMECPAYASQLYMFKLYNYS